MTASPRSVITRRARPGAPSRATAGFTLVELAVVLTIIGLLLGTMMYTFSAQVDQRNRSDTDRRLVEARELLIGFAIINGRLPCPASSTSAGDEDPAGGGACNASYSGFLPAKAIGFQPTDSTGFAVDAWGNRIRYVVSRDSTVAGSPDHNYTTTGSMKTNGITVTPSDLVVCTAAPSPVTNTTCDANTSVTNQSTVVAIVYSTGKNGSTGGTGTNEARNLDSNQLFVYRPPDPSTAAGGEFDDHLTWIPMGLLYGRLIQAGVLP